MIWTLRSSRAALTAATLAGALLSFPLACPAAAQSASPATEASAAAQAGNPAATEAAARLDKRQFRDVTVGVDQGVATLTGSVELYQDKADAEKRVRKAKGVTSVRNLIEVAGPTLPDEKLESNLQDKLAYDRVFYGNAFNAITVRVENGRVTLGGHARTDTDKDSALALVSTYPGVKDMVDKIEVDPVSIFDNRIRRQVYDAVYGYPSLNRYAIDPAKPIRISVQNGHVELYGIVDLQADKNTAFLRANGVPGVFSVKNFLQVAGPRRMKP
jgi:osmotically-inducible protein OsmY